jgi:phospholipase C
MGRDRGPTSKLAPRRAAALGAVVLTAAATAAMSSPSHAATRRVGPAGVIQHVVVIFQENHSFDETLGDYCVVHTGRCNGSIGPFTLKNGVRTSLTKSPDVINPDIPHWVSAQATEVDGGKMDGWSAIPKCVANGVNLCLTYYAPSQVPTLTSLANKYAISDRTFSMQDSPSWGGHMYAAAASQDGFTGDIPTRAAGVTPGQGWGCDSNLVATWTNPNTHVTSSQPSCVPAAPGLLNPAQYPYNGAFRATAVPHIPTIFDSLDTAHMPWRIYESVYLWAVCPTFADCLDTPQHSNMVKTTNILTDAKNGTLPAFSLVLPSGPNSTGQHPPASMLVGDNWIGTVINALQASPEWSSTAVFITYDDCGCFYDHVPPGVNPDGTKQGPRVPMVIVSPYTKVAYTDSNSATFASVLHFTEEAFGLPALGVNDAQSYDYANAFAFGSAPHAAPLHLRSQPVPASTQRFLLAHPEVLDPDDGT